MQSPIGRGRVGRGGRGAETRYLLLLGSGEVAARLRRSGRRFPPPRWRKQSIERGGGEKSRSELTETRIRSRVWKKERKKQKLFFHRSTRWAVWAAWGANRYRIGGGDDGLFTPLRLWLWQPGLQPKHWGLPPHTGPNVEGVQQHT